MKKMIAAPLAVAALLSAGGTQAQSNVTIYGQLDAAVRYTDNIDGKNHGTTQLVTGGMNANRIGFRGEEDLGDGLKALFQLESGFSPDSGKLAQQNVGGNTLFGRQAFVGLKGDFGSLTFGRQYNALNAAYSFQPIGANYWSDPFYIGGDNFFMGYRMNNSVVYKKTINGLTLQLDYSFGEQAGSTANGATFGGSLSYVSGPFNAAVAYEQAKSADGATTGKSGSIGGAYAFEKAKLFVGYLDNRESGGSDRKRDLLFGGLSYQATPALSLSGGYYHYKQSDCVGICVSTPGAINNVSGGLGMSSSTGYSTAAGKGNADIIALVGNYALSKRSTVYVEVDSTLARDGAARDDVNYWSGDVPGLTSLRRTGIMFGMRHTF
jgi:predicted porin